jgi:dipeptidase
MTVKLTVARLLLFLIPVATLVVLLAAFLSAGEPPERAERGKGHSVPEDAEVARNSKRYAFYVGKDLTEDGGVLLGGTGEEPSSHWLEIVPRQKHGPDETLTVGVTGEAAIPGELTRIPQAQETYKYITMNYSEFDGFPPPLTNGGLNEHQVAMRDVWSPSRTELIEMTPMPQRGPQYSDLAHIAMQRTDSAREAVQIIGRMIEEHGYSDYGGNSHIVADPNEGWIVIEMAGGEGLWVAERLGADEVRVAYPGYIGEIPDNYEEDPDYMGSENLISFAAEQVWYDPDSGEPFNVQEVYGAGEDLSAGPKLMAPKEIEAELEDLAPLTIEEMMNLVRDPRIADDDAGYGQVADLKADLPHEELATLWVAPTSSVTAPFIPWRIGVKDVPPEFGEHRYMTKGADAEYLNEDYQSQEATQFAGRTFKRLMYHTCEHPEKFLPEVTEALEAFEANTLSEQASVEDTALALYEAGREDLARQYLTDYSKTQAMEGLELGEALLSSIEARTKVLYGVREPEGGDINASSSSQDRNSVHCLTEGDPDFPEE